MNSNSILVISHDIIGPHMAGPGIRYRELARVLARHFPVILAMPTAADARLDGVVLWTYRPGDWASLSPAVDRAKAILLCGDVLVWFPQLAQTDIPLIVDGYDPHTFETLAMFAGTPHQAERHRERERVLLQQCRAGDFFICASERQRDWWLGLLEASGRINAATYNDDPSLRRLVDVVPFGLPSVPPRHTHRVLKGIWPGIGAADKVILWGGGLWQWLDPLSAIRAMARVREVRDDVRLVFPGTRHPNPAVPEFPMVRQARSLAEQLGLSGRQVFFGGWVPYEEWPNYLLEADIGLSLHFDTIETRMAFRSRILDYVWAGLPMVVTGGDATGELVARFGLGTVVDYEAVEQIAAAILAGLERPVEQWTHRFAEARTRLTWEKSAKALIRFCAAPHHAGDRDTADRADIQQRLAQQTEEIARLRELVAGYESGRFIRLMKWWRNARKGGRPR